MTAQETIIKYLKGRKTGATVPEIVKATGLNANTVRRIVGALDRLWCWTIVRKCRVTGKTLLAYGAQSWLSKSG